MRYNYYWFHQDDKSKGYIKTSDLDCVSISNSAEYQVQSDHYEKLLRMRGVPVGFIPREFAE